MKKIRLVIIIFASIYACFLTGCTYKGYSGDHIDLYTVAINSVLWNNGHSFSADKYADPQIEIIDSDMYGRTMFTYYEKYYAGADISFSALIICQKSNENDVFYYEDINYIVKEQLLYTESTKKFDTWEIEQLKTGNDWNQEINFNKCVKKQIVKCKPSVPYENEIKNIIIDEFHLISGEYSLFVNLLTKDSVNSNFIIYGYIRRNDEDGIYFIGFVESDKESLKEVNFLVPLSVFNYKTEFIEFKKINNWI